MPRETPPEVRFDRHTRRAGDCIVWTGARGAGGRGAGLFHDGERLRIAHRWAWEREHGAIPVGYAIYHICGRPHCVRPSHLYAYRRRIYSEDAAPPTAAPAS